MISKGSDFLATPQCLQREIENQSIDLSWPAALVLPGCVFELVCSYGSSNSFHSLYCFSLKQL